MQLLQLPGIPPGSVIYSTMIYSVHLFPCPPLSVDRSRAKGTGRCLTANVVQMGSILQPLTPTDTCSSLALAPAASMTR